MIYKAFLRSSLASMLSWSRDRFNCLKDMFYVRYTINCCMSNSDGDVMSIKVIFRYIYSQPRFHTKTERSHFKSTLSAIGASYKIADNIFYVP